MTFRAIASVPFIFLAILLVGAAALGPGDTRAIFFRIEIETVKAAGLFGCVAAAAAFDRGDYLRRAWGLLGACLFLLLVRDLSLIPSVRAALGAHADDIRSALVALANTSTIVGSWLLARAWRVAQIELPGSSHGKRAIFIAIALVVTSSALCSAYFDFTALRVGASISTVPLASDLGDLLSLWFIAPVMLTALAMRGGVLMWPWGLQTASLLAWLAYDGTVAVQHLVTLSPDAAKLTSETFRVLACGFASAAGLAQRKVIRSTPQD